MAGLVTVTDALHTVQIATTPQALFGADRAAARVVYLELAKALHPDKHGSHDIKTKVAYERAFSKLTDMWAKYNAPAPLPKIGKWDVLGPLFRGSICDLYSVKRDDVTAVLKIARSPKNNDLMKRERQALTHLATCPQADKFASRVPSLIDKFEASGRECNIITHAGHTGLPLIQSAFFNTGSGIPFRHVVWMISRILGVLGYAHDNDTVHGAVLPHHIMIDGPTHGAVLLDWTASTIGGDLDKVKVPYIHSKRYEHFYPPEVRRGYASPATDIYMTGMLALNIAGVNVPVPFHDMINSMTAASPKSRDDHAWLTLERWQDTAKRVYGPPQFVELAIPVS